MNLVIKLLINAVVFLAVSRLVPGFKVKSFGTAVACALVYGVISAITTFVLFTFLLPVTIGLALLGLHTLVMFLVTWGLILATDYLVADFEIDNAATALVGTLVFTIIRAIIHALTGL